METLITFGKANDLSIIWNYDSHVLAAGNRGESVKSIYCLSLLSKSDGVSWPLQMRADIWSDNMSSSMTTAQFDKWLNFLGARLLLAMAMNKYSSPAGFNIKWMDCSPLSAPHLATVHGLRLTNPDSWPGAPRSVTLTSIRSHSWLHLACTYIHKSHLGEMWKGFVLSYSSFSSSWLMVSSHESWIALSVAPPPPPQWQRLCFSLSKQPAEPKSNKWSWQTASELALSSEFSTLNYSWWRWGILHDASWT